MLKNDLTLKMIVQKVCFINFIHINRNINQYKSSGGILNCD